MSAPHTGRFAGSLIRRGGAVTADVSPRRASNKARVARLIAEGRMTPRRPGGDRTGQGERVMGDPRFGRAPRGPEDLAAALASRPSAAANFAGFPPSARRQLLQWVAFARRPQTRAARIAEIVAAAERNERARG